MNFTHVNPFTIGQCKRTRLGVVTEQNNHSLEICGNRAGRVCTDGCAEFFACAELAGPVLKRRKMIGSRFFDIVAYPDQQTVMTLLFSVGEGSKKAAELIEHSKLTPREREISEMICKGMANREICEKLFISHATLKTHINRIYRKMGDQRLLFGRGTPSKG